MPQIAYIVKLDQPAGTDKALTADEIIDELSAAGFSVIDVQPFSSPQEATGLGQSLLASNPGLGLLSPQPSPQN